MKILIIVLSILFVFSCSPVRYVSDHLSDAYYPAITTYNIEGECQNLVNKLQKIRVENAIHQHFQNYGFEQSDSPDLLIQFIIKEQRESFLSQECNYYGRWIYGEQCFTKVINYTEGSIVIDIINTDTQAIIWHGAIYSLPFDQIKDPNHKISEYVYKLLGDYFLDHQK